MCCGLPLGSADNRCRSARSLSLLTARVRPVSLASESSRAVAAGGREHPSSKQPRRSTSPLNSSRTLYIRPSRSFAKAARIMLRTLGPGNRPSDAAALDYGVDLSAEKCRKVPIELGVRGVGTEVEQFRRG